MRTLTKELNSKVRTHDLLTSVIIREKLIQEIFPNAYTLGSKL